MTRAQKVQLAFSGLVMAGVLLASLSGLAEVAALVKMPSVQLPTGAGSVAVPTGAIGLILAYDGMQLSAGWAVHSVKSKGALALLIMTATASGGAQGWAALVERYRVEPQLAWPLAIFIFVMHASPAVFLIGAEWLALRTAESVTKVESKPAAPRRATPKKDKDRSGSTGAAALSTAAGSVPPPAPPVETRAIEGGATLVPLDEARRKGRGRSTATPAPAPLSREQILSGLRTHFQSSDRVPSKRNIMDVVKHEILGTKEAPGKCSDRMALGLLSDLNQMLDTGT